MLHLNETLLKIHSISISQKVIYRLRKEYLTFLWRCLPLANACYRAARKPLFLPRSSSTCPLSSYLMIDKAELSARTGRHSFTENSHSSTVERPTQRVPFWRDLQLSL